MENEKKSTRTNQRSAEAQVLRSNGWSYSIFLIAQYLIVFPTTDFVMKLIHLSICFVTLAGIAWSTSCAAYLKLELFAHRSIWSLWSFLYFDHNKGPCFNFVLFLFEIPAGDFVLNSAVGFLLDSPVICAQTNELKAAATIGREG